MKKIKLLITAILFGFSLHSQAQNSNLEFGIKAGANYSKITPDYNLDGRDYAEHHRKPGFYLGAFLSKELSEKLYFQPELHFALQRSGFDIKGVELRTNDPNAGNTIVDIETNISESVITLPLVLRYYLTSSFFVDAGPQAGFILNRTEKIENNPFEESGNQGATINYDYDNFDLGLSLGTGYRLSEDMIINARYFHGIIERDNSIRPSVISLGLEYKL